MNLSNAITKMIMDMLQENDEIEIQRNIFAQTIGCVPSQINYVLSSRFTPERGYIVESRRGGGGCIRITRISYDSNTASMNLINSIGSSIDESTTRHHLSNLVYREVLSKRDAAIILSAVTDSNFRILPAEIRDSLRATILKQMLLAALQH